MAPFSLDNIFQCIFLIENVFVLIKISLKFGSIFNMSALVQVMEWRLTGDKPLPEPILTKIRHVICHAA